MPSYLGVPAALLQRLQDEEVLGVENRIEVPVESLSLVDTHSVQSSPEGFSEL